MKLRSAPIKIAVGLAVLSAFALTSGRASARDLQAEAAIVSCEDPNQQIGTAILREEGSDEGIKEVSVDVKINGNRILTEGKHAVHIHETGSCAPCGSAGGHFDPGPFGFTGPDGNHPYHSGDLVNIEILNKGQGHVRTVTSRVTLSEGPLSIIDADGSAIIIHVGEDTYCPDGAAAGCAGGARAACGIIELVD